MNTLKSVQILGDEDYAIIRNSLHGYGVIFIPKSFTNETNERMCFQFLLLSTYYVYKYWWSSDYLRNISDYG